MRSKLLAIGILGLLFLLGSSVLSAGGTGICEAVSDNPILNCGFELGNLTDWTPNAAFAEYGYGYETANPNSGMYGLSIDNYDYQSLDSLS